MIRKGSLPNATPHDTTQGSNEEGGEDLTDKYYDMLNVKKEDRARREKVEEAYKQKLEEVQGKDAKGELRGCGTWWFSKERYISNRFFQVTRRVVRLSPEVATNQTLCRRLLISQVDADSVLRS